MAEEDKVECPVCGNDVGTKEDGTLIRAHKIAGERCEGSDERVQSDDVAPTGLDRGDSFDELEASQDDESDADEQYDDASPAESETTVQGVASATSDPEFVHTVVVAYPCPYLGDNAWHHENIKMAAMEAQRAGHTLAGSEPRLVDATEQDGRIVVTYSVRVK